MQERQQKLTVIPQHWSYPGYPNPGRVKPKQQNNQKFPELKQQIQIQVRLQQQLIRNINDMNQQLRDKKQQIINRYSQCSEQQLAQFEQALKSIQQIYEKCVEKNCLLSHKIQANQMYIKRKNVEIASILEQSQQCKQIYGGDFDNFNKNNKKIQELRQLMQQLDDQIIANNPLDFQQQKNEQMHILQQQLQKLTQLAQQLQKQIQIKLQEQKLQKNKLAVELTKLQSKKKLEEERTLVLKGLVRHRQQLNCRMQIMRSQYDNQKIKIGIDIDGIKGKNEHNYEDKLTLNQIKGIQQQMQLKQQENRKLQQQLKNIQNQLQRIKYHKHKCSQNNNYQTITPQMQEAIQKKQKHKMKNQKLREHLQAMKSQYNTAKKQRNKKMNKKNRRLEGLRDQAERLEKQIQYWMGKPDCQQDVNDLNAGPKPLLINQSQVQDCSQQSHKQQICLVLQPQEQLKKVETAVKDIEQDIIQCKINQAEVLAQSEPKDEVKKSEVCLQSTQSKNKSATHIKQNKNKNIKKRRKTQQAQISLLSKFLIFIVLGYCAYLVFYDDLINTL